MKNINPEEVYPLLLSAFNKVQKIPPDLRQEFISRSDIVHFKRRDAMLAEGQVSTHAYFIISGLVMCYRKTAKRNVVKWIRSTHDYVFSIDMFMADYNYNPGCIGDIMIVLEDTTAIKVRNEDMRWFQDNSAEMSALLLHYMNRFSEMDMCIMSYEYMLPEDRYQYMQRHAGFLLNRVPDVYLAAFLEITLAELKELKKGDL